MKTNFIKKILLTLIFICAVNTMLNAQTTITTAGSSNIGYTGGNTITGDASVSFVVENTNSFNVILNGLQTIQSPIIPSLPLSPGKFYLWYSASSLSDTAIVTAPTWTKIDSSTNVTITSGYNTIFSSLNFAIPANTTYRFALESTTGIACSGGYSIGGGGFGGVPSYASPSILSADGVNLILGNALINGKEVGWSGTVGANYTQTNLAWFTGSITFQSTIVCTSPPAVGATSSTSTSACRDIPFTLTTAVNTAVYGQTYQWQSSTNGITNWTNISGATQSSLTTSQITSNYYRCNVTCSGNTATSTPLQITTAAGISGTFTINSSMLTGGTNFVNFTDAINYISCGINGPVVFNVAPNSGPYYEQIAIPFIGGTSSTNTITFNGNGVELANNGAGSNHPVVTLNGATHVIIDSLNIDCTTGGLGWGVLFTNQADSNIVRKCNITVNTTSTAPDYNIGIAINGSPTNTAAGGSNGSYNLITNNTIIGGEYGIYLYGAGIKNVGNKITNNVIQDFFHYGIAASYESQGLVIANNDVSRPIRNNSAGYNGNGGIVAGIYVAPGCQNVLIEKNKIHNLCDKLPINSPQNNGIFIYGDAQLGRENKVINNLIYNMNGDGAVSGIATVGGSYTNIYHNTIVLDDPSPSSGQAYGFWQLNKATGIRFENNIISVTRLGSGSRRCVDYESINNTNPNSFISNNNVLYMNCPNSGDAAVGGLSYVKYITLADWQAVNNGSYDQQSVDYDPIFVNAASFDYTPSSPQINNTGLNLGVTTDILGNNRATYPDPGAYEFSVAACTNPPLSGIALSSKIDLCQGNLFGLNLLGNSYGEGQTYLWQSSVDSINNWTNIGAATPNPQLAVTPNASYYYRCAVQCSGGAVVYSTNVRVTEAAILSGTYTINNAVITGGTNFQSFGDAINAIRCGISGPIIFNVVPTNIDYAEQIIIPSIAGSSATNTVKINGNGATIRFNPSNQQNPAGVMLDGADHIIIDSLNIDVSAGNYSWGILLMHQADSNIISKCVVTSRTDLSSQSSMGIVIAGSTTNLGAYGNNGNYNSITDNTVIGGSSGIYLFGNPNSTTQNIHNIIRRNKIMDMYSSGIYVYAQSAGLEIGENDISRPTRQTSAYAAAGVYLNPGCFGALLEKNKIHNFYDAMPLNTNNTYCFYIGANSSVGLENKIVNNVMYNMNGSGTQYGFYISSSSNNYKIYHNTFISADSSASSGDVYGFYQYTASATGIDFRNNLFYITRNVGNNRCISIGDTAAGVTSNNNILFCPNGNIGRVQGINYATLADWQATNHHKFDQQSAGADPLFINPSLNDFKPTATADDNVGAALNIVGDIVGVVRSIGKPDAGCYEFGTILPITSLNLKGEKSGTSNKLVWTTATENNNFGFELLRSNNATNNDFFKINFIPSKAINGNSNNTLTYTYDDVNTATNTAYYTLKQIDKDGKFYFSNIVTIKPSKVTGIHIVGIYPNPTKDNLNIATLSPSYTRASLIIADVFGKIILQQSINLIAGETATNINVNKLVAGNYTIKLSCENGCESKIEKFVKL